MARRQLNGFWVNDDAVETTADQAWENFFEALAPEIARLALADQAESEQDDSAA